MYTAEEIVVRSTLTPFDLTVVLGEMHARANEIVPIVRGYQHGWPMFARGLFVHHPRAPDRDHIALPHSKEGDAAEEIIVLAHEIGHAENCKYEPDRWVAMDLSMRMMNLKVHPGDMGADQLIQEEMLANVRGQRILKQICPQMIDEFNRQMNMSLLSFIIKLERMRIH